MSEASDIAAVLIIREGGFPGMTYDLRSGETVIGRNPNTDITLLDEGISRQHALIVHDEKSDRWTIEDLQSSNGTLVNGESVSSAELCPGDQVQIGGTVFEFSVK